MTGVQTCALPISKLINGRVPVYRVEDGREGAPAPLEQNFWVATASGAGTQELAWRATDGNWSIVVMNTDGSPGVSAEVNAGLKIASLGRLAAAVALVGAAMAAASVALIMVGTSRTGMGTNT